MDHVTARDAQREGVRHRRRRMREQARSHRAPTSDRYQTPEWLERSFVLPLTRPEERDVTQEVPSQPVPRHDDVPVRPVDSPLSERFVRPPGHDIDFGRVVRRSDLTRRVTQVHWVATGMAGLALLAYLLSPSVLLLDATVGLAVVAVGAFGARVWLKRAPVPRLQR